MIKGKTNSGFEFEVDANALDDWELLEQLNAIDKGETSMVVDVFKKLLGEEQFEALKKHIKESAGKISITGMVATLEEIFEACDSTKN